MATHLEDIDNYIHVNHQNKKCPINCATLQPLNGAILDIFNAQHIFLFKKPQIPKQTSWN